MDKKELKLLIKYNKAELKWLDEIKLDRIKNIKLCILWEDKYVEGFNIDLQNKDYKKAIDLAKRKFGAEIKSLEKDYKNIK